jgi:predicted TIM-barrel fold metal-dependent hydrolase
MAGVRELERCVKELGLHGLLVVPLTSGLPASDAKYYPMYAKCVELGVPVRIYATMNYANDRPYDLGHPRHLDQIAVDFPELKILAGLGGWPWVNDMVGLLRRHPRLYVDTAAHRPKHLATPGAGWEMMLQNVNTLLQDRFLVALAPEFFGLTYKEVIDEYLSLPLKSSVMEKIMFSNAAAFFDSGR